MSPITRREIIRNGVVAGGALFSAAAIYRADAPQSSGQDLTAPLVLRAQQLRLSAPTFRKGKQPAAGERMSVAAELTNGADEVVGHLSGEFVALGTPGAKPASALENHTFVFVDGTLVGSGTTSRDLSQADTFAIVGGTGRYIGARGTYTARQRPVELGGDGTAEYEFTLA